MEEVAPQLEDPATQEQAAKDLCRRMLQREEELRMSPEGLRSMASGREWLDAAGEMQRQVVREFGLPEDEGLALLRSATNRFPELRQFAVYARNNLARDGDLAEGAVCPDITLLQND